MKSNWIRRSLTAILLGCAQAANSQTGIPLLTQLHTGSFSTLERYYQVRQGRFEAGTLSEFELREGFRPLYDLGDEDLVQLRAWMSQQPRSYAAHLLLGIHYKHLGDAARGTDYRSQTSPSAIAEMRRQFELASDELYRSTRLTAKPYMTWFILLSMAMTDGSREDARAILDKSVHQYPVSELVRIRYMETLEPRWGGSHAEMDAFIARNRAENMPRSVIDALVAIQQDELGDSLASAGNDAAARAHFEQALVHARQSGPYLLENGLQRSRRALCTGPHPSANCP